MINEEFMFDAIKSTDSNVTSHANDAFFKIHFEGLLATTFYILLFILVTTIARLIFHRPSVAKVPESSLIILLGFAFGLISSALDLRGEDSEAGAEEVSVGRFLTFNQDTFFVVLIPPIIFEAGYFLEKNFFFANLKTILLYAVVGTILNTLGIAFGLIYLLHENFISLPVALVYGALASAVDPVAVIAIFEEVHVNETLNILVFGESVLNDAVSIVLYNVFFSFIGSTEGFTFRTFSISVAKFIYVSVGGTLIGVLCALFSAWLTKYSSHVPVMEPLIVFVLAYFSYIVADILGTSGIMAILFCSIAMSYYTQQNISFNSKSTIKYSAKMAAATAETLVFLILGVSLVDIKEWQWSFVLVSVLLVEVVRAIIIFGLTWLANFRRIKKVPLIDQFIMVYGGLRGAIAFSLAFILPAATIQVEGSPFDTRELLISTTLAIIVVTVFIQGSTIKPLLRFLHVALAKPIESDANLGDRVFSHVLGPSVSAMNHLLGNQETILDETWQKIDSWLATKLLKKNMKEETQLLRALDILMHQEAYKTISTLTDVASPMPMEGYSGSYSHSIGSPSGAQTPVTPFNVGLTPRDIEDMKMHHREFFDDHGKAKKMTRAESSHNLPSVSVSRKRLTLHKGKTLSTISPSMSSLNITPPEFSFSEDTDTTHRSRSRKHHHHHKHHHHKHKEHKSTKLGDNLHSPRVKKSVEYSADEKSVKIDIPKSRSIVRSTTMNLMNLLDKDILDTEHDHFAYGGEIGIRHRGKGRYQNNAFNIEDSEMHTLSKEISTRMKEMKEKKHHHRKHKKKIKHHHHHTKLQNPISLPPKSLSSAANPAELKIKLQMIAKERDEDAVEIKDSNSVSPTSSTISQSNSFIIDSNGALSLEDSKAQLKFIDKRSKSPVELKAIVSEDSKKNKLVINLVDPEKYEKEKDSSKNFSKDKDIDISKVDKIEDKSVNPSSEGKKEQE